ncbi:MAG TPA: hypothetical protein VEJ18_18625 [Planctomycetota bacterium]|nr:hypothetical protein [Planctomycetota bacterium]
MILLLCALAAQEAENPDYRAWSAFKPGSWVKLRIRGEASEKEVTVRLVQVTPEQVVVERTTRSRLGTRTVAEAPYLESIPARKPRIGSVLREVEEELEAGGRRLRTRMLELEQREGEKVRRVKIWASPEVPGGAVKMDVRPAGADRPELVLEAVDWERR